MTSQLQRLYYSISAYHKALLVGEGYRQNTDAQASNHAPFCTLNLRQ